MMKSKKHAPEQSLRSCLEAIGQHLHLECLALVNAGDDSAGSVCPSSVGSAAR